MAPQVIPYSAASLQRLHWSLQLQIFMLAVRSMAPVLCISKSAATSTEWLHLGRADIRVVRGAAAAEADTWGRRSLHAGTLNTVVVAAADSSCGEAVCVAVGPEARVGDGSLTCGLWLAGSGARIFTTESATGDVVPFSRHRCKLSLPVIPV